MAGSRDFNPDHRCLGGAYRISEDYRCMSKKIIEARPTVATHFHDIYEDLRASHPGVSGASQARPKTARRQTSVPAYTVNQADRLSKNRALRHAAVSTAEVEHATNVLHMHRRIEEQFKVCERKKDRWDLSVYPVFKPRPQKTSVVRSLCPWLPQNKPRQERAKSAPPVHGRAEAPPFHNELDVQRYDAFRAAIMADIAKHRVFQEPDLRKLFRSWVNANPREFHPILLQAIADIKVELDVS